MRRVLALVAGLAGAALLSQYPAFSQQYLQRLAGQVDALAVVARDFDASALSAGLGREEALAQMTDTAFLQSRQADMRRTFARHARLADNLIALRNATPMQRIIMPHRMADTTTLSAAWSDFEPAMPLSTAGAATAGVGFLAGWAGVSVLLAALSAPFRRGPSASHRAEPAIRRATPRTAAPRLEGVRR